MFGFVAKEAEGGKLDMRDACDEFYDDGVKERLIRKFELNPEKADEYLKMYA